MTKNLIAESHSVKKSQTKKNEYRKRDGENSYGKNVDARRSTPKSVTAKSLTKKFFDGERSESKTSTSESFLVKILRWESLKLKPDCEISRDWYFCSKTFNIKRSNDKVSHCKKSNEKSSDLENSINKRLTWKNFGLKVLVKTFEVKNFQSQDILAEKS